MVLQSIKKQYKVGSWGLIHGKDTDFLPSSPHPNQLWGPTNLTTNGYQRSLRLRMYKGVPELPYTKLCHNT
jgi:hypothetical protein